MPATVGTGPNVLITEVSLSHRWLYTFVGVTVDIVLDTRVLLFHRWFCTCLHVAETADTTVLNREVFSIQALL